MRSESKWMALVVGSLMLVGLSWGPLPGAEAKESIQSILDAPENFKNRLVELEGCRVVRLTRQEGETYFYEIQDDFLAKIEVRTTGSPPKAGDMIYRLSGVVTVGPTGEVFLDEKSIGFPVQASAPVAKETSWAPMAAAGAAGVLALVLMVLVVRAARGPKPVVPTLEKAGGTAATGSPTDIYNQPTEVVRHDESKIAIATPKQA